MEKENDPIETIKNMSLEELIEVRDKWIPMDLANSTVESCQRACELIYKTPVEEYVKLRREGINKTLQLVNKCIKKLEDEEPF